MKGYEAINASAEKVAAAIHDVLGTAHCPSVLSLRSWMEESFGIRIHINYTRSEQFTQSGLEYYDPEKGGYMVWINAGESEKRQLFTLCHEFGHILRNSGKAFGFSDGNIYSAWGEERFCNRFAAAFLMPRETFIQKWSSIREELLFKKVRIASIFGVSGDAVYFRAKELGLLETD